jgi:transcriptional regulator with XRE-family HTH domain
MTRSNQVPGTQPTNLIGPQVRWMRERLGITQDELAGRLSRYGLELDYVKIGQIENGKRRVVDLELLGFARALGVSVDWLLCGENGRL